jgi:outer membrane receptor protein involved in Fe transport
VAGIYVNDLWQITDQLRLNAGLRWDVLTGFTNSHQFDPTISLSYQPISTTTLHAGFARYMQVPSFQGISPNAPAVFSGTTGSAGSSGAVNPLTEDDYEFDAGIVQHVTPSITLSADAFYEITHHYLDTGQFGVVPIFAPFNYDHGHIWGTEFAAAYKNAHLSLYANVTLGRNLQTGVKTGQFNFDPTELAYIDVTISCSIINRWLECPLEAPLRGTLTPSALTRPIAVGCGPGSPIPSISLLSFN